ncbi:HET-domain-containing protein [Lophiostoma macrostomum CBS 122681]|uniref:HET-domain-containing protein n=1 Tax=Lophiostoma macrostomum CBS 122681 TaxID=1314788 RepID=A0A6A6TMN4_9PLEO|nr:HET-domain-containing protein [Lophiostoma macrostomum CBS 122681]
MRLIDVEAFLKAKNEAAKVGGIKTTLLTNDLPPPSEPYAILSHRWDVDTKKEVSYQDINNPNIYSVEMAQKPGFAKIVKACSQASSDGYRYIWVDTCCIDKTNSTELSEAINSMYSYYRDAAVCYAYLFDWDSGNEVEHRWESFKHSSWFKRGWTLQELIASRTILFFDKDWNHAKVWIKTHFVETEFLNTLQDASGIEASVLNGVKKLHQVPVAVRMSWASLRQTGRLEDVAYSLLGIFDVNMAMLYGEGSKAFLRLQEHIIAQTTDLSIFAWRAPRHFPEHTGILAPDPSFFKGMGSLRTHHHSLLELRDFALTNRGVKFNAPLPYNTMSGSFVLPINHGIVEHANLAIGLRPIGSDLFVCLRPQVLVELYDRHMVYPAKNKTNESFHVKTLTKEESQLIEDNVLILHDPVDDSPTRETWYRRVEPAGA